MIDPSTLAQATPGWLALLQAVPSPSVLTGWDKLGIVAVIFAFITRDGVLLLTRKVVLGSTCDLLVENESKQKEAALEEARGARADLGRVADEFNANFSLVVKELTRRRDGV